MGLWISPVLWGFHNREVLCHSSQHIILSGGVLTGDLHGFFIFNLIFQYFYNQSERLTSLVIPDRMLCLSQKKQTPSRSVALKVYLVDVVYEQGRIQDLKLAGRGSKIHPV